MKHLILLILGLMCFESINAQDLIWITPYAPDYKGREFVSEQNHLDIKLRLLTNNIVQPSDFTIYINNQPLPSYKAGEVSLVGRTFKATIPLQNGNQQIEVSYKNNTKEYRSEILQVNYSAGKANLYLLAFGTDPVDLEYTDEDAWDFANAFRGQAEGKDALFGKVEVRTLLGEQATASAMLREVERLSTLYKIGDIKSNDVVILFSSSHGAINNNRFYLKGNDYSSMSPTSTSLRYENILEHFDAIDCKKICFIDACHSGEAKGNEAAISNAIIDLSRNQNGLTTITSSSAEELSYEDAAWKNGAFTESILEGLQGKADANNDDIIYIEELYNYVKKQTKSIVHSIKNQWQNPQLTRDELGNLPLYKVSNHRNKIESRKVENLLEKRPTRIGEKGYMTDARDGQRYKTVMLKDGKIWMAQNLNFQTNDSYCYKKDPENCKEYGRLYKWNIINKICPKNWHLPNVYEWRAMIEQYGSDYENYNKLISGGATGFSAKLGGYRSTLGTHFYIEKHGYYWSSILDDDKEVWLYKFHRPSQKLRPLKLFRDSLIVSCRCVQD